MGRHNFDLPTLVNVILRVSTSVLNNTTHKEINKYPVGKKQD